jgi:polysaccharide export outer membrane protein
MERSPARWTIVLVLFSCLIGFFTACASSTPGGSVEVDQFKQPPDPPAGSEYTIGVGDLLDVQVWEQEKMSAKIRVRSDGRISLPFLNDVEVVGKTPNALNSELEAGLKSVILNPKVTVVVAESRPLSVSVLGEVVKPGLQTLEPGAGVIQALAAAGGLSTFAHKDRIFVVRSTPQSTRIHFTYGELTSSAGKAGLFRLRSGDVIVVE